MPKFRCPHCGESLDEHDREFFCSNGHHFDRAKDGYVNLLPSGRLKGRPSGDDEAMVRARRAVFDADLYRPVVDAVAAMLATSRPTCVVDAGCGEGSYLAATTRLSGASGWGIDVSKPAIRLAARRHQDHHYAIASSYAMPFADGSFDALINVFSPRDFVEMERVLAVNGVAVVVTPGPRHLAQLKEIIYDDPRQHAQPSTFGDSSDEPVADDVQAVSFELDLHDARLRLSLLEMTPFWWSTVPERREIIASTTITVEVDVRLSLYRRQQHQPQRQ